MKRHWEEEDQFTDRILYACIVVFGVFVRSVSRKKSSTIARLLGDFTYDILKLRRKLVIRNLSITFPEKKISAIHSIARQVYRNQAENFIEILRLPMIKTAEDAAGLIEIDAGDFLAKTLDKNKGGIIVSAHFGNWELMALCSGLLVAPVTIVVKPMRNQAIDRQINSWRTMLGNRILYDSQAVRRGLKILREGGILSILGDQSGGSFFTEFMGRRAQVFLGPAYLALKTGVPLFVAMCRRVGDGRYKVDCEEIDTTALGCTTESAEELVRRYTSVFERYIYRYPEEWFWLHNRWRDSDD